MQCYVFNNARKFDFFPELGFEGEAELKVVDELKLLGVMVTSNLSWQSHVDYMSKRAFTMLWMIRRLKPLGASIDELLQVYQTQIRCILEFAVAAWNSGLTKGQVSQIEQVQKCVLAIILEKDYLNYENALVVSGLERLDKRRNDLCLTFAKRAQKHPKLSKWFCKNEQAGVGTRSTKTTFKPVKARTGRYEKSPIAYLTRLLNEQ